MNSQLTTKNSKISRLKKLNKGLTLQALAVMQKISLKVHLNHL